MIRDGEKIVWGIEEGQEPLSGLVTRKRTGNGGSFEMGLDRVGAVRRLAVRDRHKTISITATVTSEVNEYNIPQLGERFMALVNGRMVEFRCTDSDIEEFIEDTAVMHVSGRTLGETPVCDGTNAFRNTTSK